jgi:hypothetical protein
MPSPAYSPSTGSIAKSREVADADLADIGWCCYDPRFGGPGSA